MAIDYNGLPARFFSLFADKSQGELAKHFGLKQPQISAWKTGKEKIPWERLEYVIENKGVTWDWLLTGVEKASPPTKADGDESILPQLSRMAIELMDTLNDFHLRALEGVITEEAFQAVLLAATDSIAKAARENGVETKKGIA